MSPFETAFAAARKAGKKVFSFNGKEYNTKYKEEVGTPPKPRPKSEMRPKARPMAKTAAPKSEAGFLSKERGVERRKAVGKFFSKEEGTKRRKAVGNFLKKKNDKLKSMNIIGK